MRGCCLSTLCHPKFLSLDWPAQTGNWRKKTTRGVSVSGVKKNPHLYTHTHTHPNPPSGLAIIPTLRPRPRQQPPPHPSRGNAKVFWSGAEQPRSSHPQRRAWEDWKGRRATNSRKFVWIIAARGCHGPPSLWHAELWPETFSHTASTFTALC